MQYVYILKSDEDDELYIGCTKDLKKRVELHNSKKVPSTEKRGRLKLIYYEAFISKDDVFARERFFKTGWGRTNIKKLLFNFFNN
ncbi:MAG: GIY-YIG nuclease family protein [Candidatus Paceibacterota bacterium]|jgi:putative endonuclease